MSLTGFFTRYPQRVWSCNGDGKWSSRPAERRDKIRRGVLADELAFPHNAVCIDREGRTFVRTGRRREES